MHFKICCFEDIRYHASAHARAVLANSRDAVDMVVESLMSAALMDIVYTRSIALVAISVEERLAYDSATLSRKFSDCLADAVMVAFMRYWEVPDCNAKQRMDMVDPVALSAFIGDLFSVRILSFREFEECFGVLLELVSDSLARECLHVFLAHGGLCRRPEMTRSYLLKCLDSIERRCAAESEIDISETSKLSWLVYDIIVFLESQATADVVERQLNLDTALTASVCYSVCEWLYDDDDFDSPTSPSSTTSELPCGEKETAAQSSSPMASSAEVSWSSSSGPEWDSEDSASSDNSLELNMPRPFFEWNWVHPF